MWCLLVPSGETCLPASPAEAWRPLAECRWQSNERRNRSGAADHPWAKPRGALAWEKFRAGGTEEEGRWENMEMELFFSLKKKKGFFKHLFIF